MNKDGAPLEVLAGTVVFERSLPLLIKGLGYSGGGNCGWSAFDLGGGMSDENIIRHYRSRLTQSGTL